MLSLLCPLPPCQGSTERVVVDMCSDLPAEQLGAPAGACYATVQNQPLAYREESYFLASKAVCRDPGAPAEL